RHTTNSLKHGITISLTLLWRRQRRQCDSEECFLYNHPLSEEELKKVVGFDAPRKRAGDSYNASKQRAGDSYDASKQRAGDSSDASEKRAGDSSTRGCVSRRLLLLFLGLLCCVVLC
ncbi:surface glycoprotein, partial [Trypanosoma rangeli]